jgi:hypothetical protein
MAVMARRFARDGAIGSRVIRRAGQEMARDTDWFSNVWNGA